MVIAGTRVISARASEVFPEAEGPVMVRSMRGDYSEDTR
jgi:hypothetical protein